MSVLAEIAGPGMKFIAKGTFIVDVDHLEDGTVFVSHRSLPVDGYGMSMEEALEAFAEVFELQWQTLVDANLGTLTERAKELRSLFAAAAEIAPQ